MSPHTKKVGFTATVLGAAIVCGVGLGFRSMTYAANAAIGQAATTAVAKAYVAADTFRDFRAQLREQQLRDSMANDYRQRAILDRIARMDTTLRDIRSCQRRQSRREACE